MKKTLLIAAGIFAIAASPALAYSPPMSPDMAKAVKEVWADQNAADQVTKIDATASWTDDSKLAKAQPAAAEWFDDGLVAKSDKDLLAGELGGPTLPAPVTTTADAQGDMSAYQGVGGPLEEVDYPTCSRSVTDSCIQLNDRP